ncbi:MAG: ABC transporter permease subunit [Bacteroidia bacterium]|nr:ABC transporter permease subunit [Bacteroidia bacterium]
MIWHIVKKDFLDNFTSARFVVGFLLCLFLVPYTVYTGTRVYESRVEKYQRDVKNADEVFTKAQVYAQIQPRAVIQPSPLNIFCKGISEQVGSQVSLNNNEVPTFATGITTMYENQFLNRFISLDFVNILAIILSLIGVFLSYDIFSREKEDGTLKLLLSNQVKRSDYFLGKAGGILLTFIPLLLVCYILVFIILWISPSVSLSADDYVRIMILFLFSLLYLSFFIFLGSYISSKARTSSTSLIINLFIWCFLLFLLPNAMSYLGKNIVKSDNYSIVRLNTGDLDNEFWKKYGELQKKVENETGMTAHHCNLCAGWNYGMIMMCFTPIADMNYTRRMHELAAPMVLDYAIKKWQLQEAYLNRLYHQQKIIKYLSCLSPSEILKYVSASLCKSDMESHIDFMERARSYREVFFDYYKENKIFSSYNYFSPHKESEIPKTQEEAEKMQAQWRSTAKPESTFDLSSLGYVQTAGLPRFTYSERGIIDGLSDQLWIFAGLIAACALLIWITYRSFIKYDIR